MSKTAPTQLALIDVPGPTRLVRQRQRQRMPPAMVVEHCNALLAELDRVALAQLRRAEQLVQLFEATERAHSDEDDDFRFAREASG